MLNRDKVRLIAEKLKDGGSYADLAEELGVHEQTIRGQVTRKSVDNVLEAFGYLDQGLTLEETGQKMGLTKQRVSQLVGPEGDNASRGWKLSIDASEETWTHMLELAESMDIRVRGGGNRLDGRAITELMDKIAAGELNVVRVR